MNIEWNTVTWYSKVLAIIVFVGTFTLGGYLGIEYQKTIDEPLIHEKNLELSLAKSEIERLTPPPPSIPTSFITLTKSPAEAAKLCQGAPVEIAWNVSDDIRAVRLGINTFNKSGSIGEFAPTPAEGGVAGTGGTIWRAGGLNGTSGRYTQFIGAGELFQISVAAFDESFRAVATTSSETFSIQLCQGQ